MISKRNVLVIVNPCSGRRLARKRKSYVLYQLKKACEHLRIVETSCKGDAIDLVQKIYKEEPYEYLIGMGGDGTNNEIVNGLMALDNEERQKIHYALLPCGTGNDWSRGHDIPLNAVSWWKMWIAADSRKHDMGMVRFYDLKGQTERYFVNVAGLAYDAYLVRKLEEGFMPKKNKLVYLAILLRCLITYKLHHAKVRSNDGFDLKSKFYTLNVGVNRFAGGGMEIVPNANPFDGKLSFSAAKDLKKYQVVWEIRRFYNGTYLEHPKVEHFDSEGIDIENLSTGRSLGLEVDGEYVGTAPCTFVSVPAAIRVILPKGR